LHASQDLLTGLLNRRAITQLAGNAINMAMTQNIPLVVAMIDADFFKILTMLMVMILETKRYGN
jgi:GGDEF domain-containing protein